MEAKELSLIDKYGVQDTELKALWDQHIEYEKMLEKMESKPYLSPTQKQELKILKKKKLAGKTKLQYLLDKYRELEG
ncbi:MAG: DUF465 domain-containing protein [Desulfovibrionaceae bacterium]|nr:DUF465 domain-containing protein [Desulfovibrionaceae bacterium]MDD4951168.1 DUF465 domain-containing protein [Desulfovibrionaceae bacterium]